jgi:hypothetical protein
LRALSSPGFHLLVFDDDGTALTDVALATLASAQVRLQAPPIYLHRMRPALASSSMGEVKSRALHSSDGQTTPPAPACSVWHDAEGLLRERCGARHGTTILLRPDQMVCARWRAFDAPAIVEALLRALGRAVPTDALAPGVSA